MPWKCDLYTDLGLNMSSQSPLQEEECENNGERIPGYTNSLLLNSFGRTLSLEKRGGIDSGPQAGPGERSCAVAFQLNRCSRKALLIHHSQ